MTTSLSITSITLAQVEEIVTRLSKATYNRKIQFFHTIWAQRKTIILKSRCVRTLPTRTSLSLLKYKTTHGYPSLMNKGHLEHHLHVPPPKQRIDETPSPNHQKQTDILIRMNPSMDKPHQGCQIITFGTAEEGEFPAEEAYQRTKNKTRDKLKNLWI